MEVKIPRVVLKKSKVHKATLNYLGDMYNAYNPLFNLVDEKTSRLKDFTTEHLNFDLEHPVDILIQESYDGSVNLILNDDKNSPRLVNSRFSIQENNKFLIPEHRGYKDTNVYNEDTFAIDTALKPIPLKIPNIEYNGLYENLGDLSCGSYTFYFKLSDADGNESEVIAETGVVLVHLGTPNNPQEIRMGLENENSKKSIQFTLTNLDSGFDYIHVLFARSSSGSDLAKVDSYHKINFNYPINQGSCIIHITGNEHINTVELKELYVDYADIQSVKTLTECANVLMFGNISKPIHDYDVLQLMAWRIIPKIRYKRNEELVGHINTQYKDSNVLNSLDNNLCYYNTKNIYYYLGYWPGEIYRFGIVYIFKDNSLSPVFNIQGLDFTKVLDEYKDTDVYTRAFFRENGEVWECSPEDHMLGKLIIYNNEVIDTSAWKLNAKGVIKMPYNNTFSNSKNGILQPNPIGIEFDLSYVNIVEKFSGDTENLFEKHGIKGFFFVRLKRIPTILGLGITIGVTNKSFGCIPVIHNNNQKFIAESFLKNDRLLYDTGTFVEIPSDNVKVRGLLMPDAEMCEGIYNDIFTGTDFCIEKVGAYRFNSDAGNNSYYETYIEDEERPKHVVSLLNIPEDISILSNGEDYFSTVAGSASEPYKTIDVKHAWDLTVPQTLTTSTSLVRGKFGAFVGIGSPTHDDTFPFLFGEVYNVKDKRYAEDEESSTLLDFLRRFNDFSEYKAICHRTELIDTITCYRGDCYHSMFTHRMHRNFIDPELPTNTKIVDPSCWAANYAVRCTAPILTEAHSNLTDDSDGWVIPTPKNLPWIQALIYFLTGNIFGAIKELVDKDKPKTIEPDDLGLGSDYYWDPVEQAYYTIEYQKDDNGNIKYDDNKMPIRVLGTKFDPNDLSLVYKNGFANEIVQAFEVYIGDDPKGVLLRDLLKKKKVNPLLQESSGGINFKAIFKADDKWDLRGLANINRADVNAVGLGHWITFPILSSRNLAFRDIDYSNSTELASFNRKRSFYPLAAMSKNNPLRDSNVINAATSISIPHKPYFGITDYRFLKQEYFTRVYNSLTDSANSFTNEYKLILEISFLDYTKKCGSITKMITINNIVYVIFEHGIGQVTFQPTHPGVSPEMMQDVILLQDSYGSIWKDSIIEAAGVIYGVDSVAKKIWCIANKLFKIISDFKVLKFLIDNLDMSEYTTKPYLGHVNIKTHYNAYKNDVIFTYYNDTPIKDDYTGEILEWKTGKTWSLCYNMILDTFTTFYDWYPVESVNIDNIYFSFDLERFNELTKNNFVPEKNIVKGLNNNDNTIFSYGVTSYKTKKYKIDPMFNHEITIFELPGNTAIKIRPGYSNRIISFYYKGNIKLSHSQIKYSSEQVHTYSSNIWEHVLILLPQALHDDTIWLTLSAIDGAEVSEIAYYSTDVYPEINKLDLALCKSGYKDIYIYNLTDISKLLKYNIRNTQNLMYLWKHGQAGVYDIQGTIKPTTWYNKQHGFSFEFIVNELSSILKIFNNLKIISNKTEPYKFEYEVVGEGYEWYELKPVIKWIHDKVNKGLPNNITENLLDYWYKEVLNNTYGDLQTLYPDFPYLYGKQIDYIISKLPYIDIIKDYTLMPPTTTLDFEHTHNSSKTGLVYDVRLNDYNVRTTQIGNDIKKVGRAKGNMLYLEDLWDVEIRPIAFKYVYIDNDGNLTFTSLKETRHRDKYLKVKVCYSGEDLAVIQAIQTTFDFSYA